MKHEALFYYSQDKKTSKTKCRMLQFLSADKGLNTSGINP